MIRTLGAAGFLVLFGCLIFGQTAPPAFDVASIKPSNSPILDFRIQPGGRLEVLGQTLNVIIRQAFNVKYYQIAGGPSWIDVDRFDIVAKAEGEPNRETVLAMLRTLLADRFKLQTRRESREGNVYNLVVAKNGPKLNPPTGDRSYIRTLRLTPLDQKGINYALDAKKTTMAAFADRLIDAVSRPVIDRTGLSGEFDFRVDYSVDDNPETGPPIFVAIQNQLGLKLDSGKGPIETLVIEHAEKPSGN
jgi:uncharacterized protein (TIGR03435 family)